MPQSLRKHTSTRDNQVLVSRFSPLKHAVPAAVVHAVWDAFNTIADGLAINEAEAISICSCLQSVLKHDRGAVASATRRMFALLDLDRVSYMRSVPQCDAVTDL